jgi:hypothetical protein
MNGTCVWSKSYSFKASPYPGQGSLQRVIIFGNMRKVHVCFHVYPSFSQITNWHFPFSNVLNLLTLFLQAEADGSNEFNNFQPGSINTTYQIISNLEKHWHCGPHWGHLLREWLLVSMGPVHCTDWPIASTVPYMIGRSAECSSSILSYVPLTYSCILLTRRGIFAVVTMRGIDLALVHSTGISTPVENAVSLPKLCSTLQLRTVQNSGNCS